jgi:anti-anti-sigma factor
VRPSDRRLEINVSERPGGVLVRLRGSATMEQCERLKESLLDIAEGSPPVMVLDMADLDFICSLGLGSIVAAYLGTIKHEGRVVVTNPNEAIRNVLEITRLNELLAIEESPEVSLGA